MATDFYGVFLMQQELIKPESSSLSWSTAVSCEYTLHSLTMSWSILKGSSEVHRLDPSSVDTKLEALLLKYVKYFLTPNVET